MKKWIYTYVILNLLDMLSTLGAVEWLEFAWEANPLMQAILDTSPVAFVLTKLGTTALGLLLLDVKFTPRTALLFKVVVAGFGLLMLWHAINWAVVLALS